MPILISAPSVIQAAGNKPKIIEEFIGRVNSRTEPLSVARMKSPSGWVEPGQTPEFDEYTLVLRGKLLVTAKSGVVEVLAVRRSSRIEANGCSTVRPDPKARNTLPSVCLLSPWRVYIETIHKVWQAMFPGLSWPREHKASIDLSR